MHDPCTVAHNIRLFGKPVVTIWHVDPESDGTDDSCGWFLRSRHLDQEVLESIIRRYESVWDNKYTDYLSGLFDPEDGQPQFSVTGTAVQLFWLAAIEYLGRRKAEKYMKEHIWDIVRFAENPTDSIHGIITRKYEVNTEYTKTNRDNRLSRLAKIVYAYIARDIRPWYKHPRWHVWHWRFQFHLRRIK